MKNKFKHVGILILVILIVTGGLIYFLRKQIVMHFIPNVEQVGEININVTNDTTYVSSKLALKNKSFFKIEIDSIKYKVSLFGKTYLQNQKYLGVVLNGNELDTLDFSLKIPYVAILKDLKVERKKGDSASYSINISLQYSTFFGKVEIPINKEAKIKIPQPPEINIVEIKYYKARFKSIQAIAKIKVVNYSDVTLLINDINYSMSILKKGNLKGNHKEPIIIKPTETTYINLPIEINFKNIGKTLFEVIMNKDNYNYTIKLDAILETKGPINQSLNISITKSGMMELRK